MELRLCKPSGHRARTQRTKFAVLVKKSCSPQLATSILILLCMHEGKTSPESSNFLGGSYSTVAYLCVDGDCEHLESRRDRREKGNYTKVIK